MTLDATAGALALKLINKFGKTVVLTTNAPGVYDPATSQATVATSAVTIKAAVSDLKQAGSGQALFEGLAETTNKKILIAAKAVSAKPTTQDSVTIDGVVYTVANVKSLYSGELVAAYELVGNG